MKSSTSAKLTDYSWISGLVGMLSLVFWGYCASYFDVFTNGWVIFSIQITDSLHASILFVLAVTSSSMFITEVLIRVKVEGKKFISISEKLKQNNYLSFLLEWLITYGFELLLIFVFIQFFKYAGEYGFQKNALYYRPWFRLLDIIFSAYLYFGFFYILLTRIFQADKEADSKEPVFLFIKFIIIFLDKLKFNINLSRLTIFDLDKKGDSLHTFDLNDRKIVLGLIVKLFFIPLMTIFFVDQFSHFVKNWTYLADEFMAQFGQGMSWKKVILDFFNISFTLIFCIDVGLAWGGYTLSSRWIKNTYISVEPTLLGWSAALLCYPPFQRLVGLYLTVPSERAFMAIETPWLLAIIVALSISSYALYMSATLVFGLRFSNLTHRGIIKKGPYSLIRHPAYAAKNFSWWCLMMPMALYHGITNDMKIAIVHIIGLIFMTSLYYIRAVTEERHLSIDPEYIKYMKKVPYRFIPGVV